MGRELEGGLCPFLGGRSWVPVKHNVAWSEAYLHTKWHLNPSSHLATMDIGQKLGLCPYWLGAGSLSNTMWPGQRPISVTLIHPTNRPADRIGRTILGRPFVKWFALCYWTVVLSCVYCPVLSVTLVYCGQTVGWIKMKLGMQVGLGPGHMLDGDPAPLSQRGTAPQYSPHVFHGNLAGWIKMPLGMEVGLGPGGTEVGLSLGDIV